MVTTQMMTIADVEAMGPDAERYELVRGVLREVEGTSEHHGATGGRAIVYIGGFVFEHDLGEVFISGSRFTFPGSPPSWLAPAVENRFLRRLLPAHPRSCPRSQAPLEHRGGHP